MKQFTNFKTFKKVVRKYWKRHAIKGTFYCDGKKYTSWDTWTMWCYYLVNDMSEFNEKDKALRLLYDLHEDDIPDFISDASSKIGHEVNVINRKGELKGSGVFAGVALVNNCVLYAIDNKNKREFYFVSVNLEIKK